MEKLTKVCLVAGFLVTECMVGNSFAYSAWRLDEKQNKMVWTDLDKTGNSPNQCNASCIGVAGLHLRWDSDSRSLLKRTP